MKLHLIIESHGTPEQHRQFQQRINDLKYPVEGKLRKGYCIPHLSEFKTWDIRIKKDVAAQFLRDMDVMNTEFTHPNHKIHFRTKLYKFVIKIIRWILKMKDIKYEHLDKKYKPYDGWYQNFFIGAIKDPEDKNGTELL